MRSGRKAPPLAKPCIACGREMQWRKRWEKNWDSVRYCSSACRKRGVTTVDQQLEQAIADLLARRDVGATICPSEAARVVGGTDTARPDHWRELMEPARRAARRLVHAGAIEITQGGRAVDPTDFRGPVRLRRTRSDR